MEAIAPSGLVQQAQCHNSQNRIIHETQEGGFGGVTSRFVTDSLVQSRQYPKFPIPILYGLKTILQNMRTSRVARCTNRLIVPLLCKDDLIDEMFSREC